MYGDNPAEVLADQIYWTQENRKYTDNEVVWIPKQLRVEYILASGLEQKKNSGGVDFLRKP